MICRNKSVILMHVLISSVKSINVAELNPYNISKKKVRKNSKILTTKDEPN